MKKSLLIAGVLTLATVVACNNESKNDENKDTVAVPSTTDPGMSDTSSRNGDTASYERMQSVPVDSLKR